MSTARKTFYAAILAAFLLAAAELSLRAAGFHYQRSLSYMRFNFPDPDTLHNIFEPDERLLWRMRPGYDFGEGFPPLNGHGFRGGEFGQERKERVVRIACIGDSVTFGGADLAYPAALEGLLESELGEVEVMNFGVPGYSSYQGKLLLETVLEKYRPDVAVILFGWNDHYLAQGFSDDRQMVEVSDASRALDSLRNLRLYQLVNLMSARAAGAFSSPGSRPARALRVPPDDFARNLAAMVDMTRAAGALPVLATAPAAFGLAPVPDYFVHLGFVEKEEDLEAMHGRYNDLTRRVSADTGARLADLDLLFKKRGATSLFDDPGKDLIHPNRSGYTLMAEAVSREILESFSGRP